MAQGWRHLPKPATGLLAPKDDMPYAFFHQHLISFGAQAVECAKATAGK